MPRVETTSVEQLATWASEVTIADVPADVLDLARAQRRSVLAAMAASVDDEATGRLLAAVSGWASDGPAPLVTTDRRVSVEDALYAAAAFSVALDSDDYLCFGHTGHSAVLAPILLAAETGADGEAQLLAQIVANEVEARLGGAVLLGPMNGQLWAFIHAAGTALAAGRLLGLDRDRLAHALAIALAHPMRATVPGFMAPDSKLLVAAEPTVAGLRAARLAAVGVTGPLDALDDRRGALAALSYAPIPGILAGLGTGWATKTLCIKPYPGCAYIDTTVDALLDLGLGAVDADDVESVTVDAGMLTCGMDHLSGPYAAVEPPTPVTVTFSIPWNAAIVLVAGRLTEAETSAEWLRANAADLAAVRSRVTLRHDAELTTRSAAAFGRLIPGPVLAKDVGARRLLSAARRVRAEHPTGLGAADLLGLLRTGRSGRAALRAARGGTWWDPAALDGFQVTFPARVTVRTRDGSEHTAEADVPRGGAGNRETSPIDAARAKLAASGPRLWGEAGTAALDAAIADDDAKLFDLLGGSRS
ncbi:MAG TPA: MmgE/PrpD family protein [Acidimicrobiia bacterium]|nr:MmgE/PrpD family protein [Acidimicrobiia bacterium]